MSLTDFWLNLLVAWVPSKDCGIVRTSAPKHTGAETLWTGSLGPPMCWGTRAANLSIYTTKMEDAGPKIVGTGATFKRVPCQKSWRVNRA